MKGLAAIDPGANGAIAFWEPSVDRLQVWDMPTHTITVGGRTKKVVDVYALGDLIRWLADNGAECVVIEEVSAMPKQGVVSTFSFGFAAGAVQAATATAQIPMELVRPSVWKRGLRVSADKDSSRRRASQIFPKHAHLWSRKRDDGRAEAALLAYFGKQFLRRESVLD